MLAFPDKFYCAGKEYSTYEKHVPAPIFRKSFVLEAKPEKAEILISGLGFYDLFINGKKITKGYLAPYISNTDDIVYFDYYDLTGYLHEGENVIGVMLGTGMQNLITACWDFDKAVFRSSPKMALAFRCECSGAVHEFDAGSFLCSESEITFDNLRCGTHCDARRRQPGWNEPGFDDSSWKKVILAETPRGEAKLCDAEPIVITAERPPVKVEKGSRNALVTHFRVPERDVGVVTAEPPQPLSGGYIYDFGVNSAGIYRLKVRGKPGQKIQIQCAEWMNNGNVDHDRINEFYPDGYCQRDIYICSGEGEEVFEPPFTYHGFRYCYVTGITEDQATPELLTYLEMHSDLKTRGGFTCSDPIANKLFEMVVRTDLANFYYFPTDCPHREKNGWTGDAAVSAERMMLLYTAERSFREWLCNIRKAQDDRGALPGIVPTTGWGFHWGNGPAWDCVLFILPYYIYLYRGDTEIIRENAHAMMRYIEYISGRRNERGIIACGLGDWNRVGYPGTQPQAPLGFTDSVMVLNMCRLAEKMFRAVGYTLNESYVKAFGDELFDAIRREYVDTGKMIAAGGSQTAQAMALYYNIFVGDERKAAFGRLMETIHADGDSINTGILGARVLFHVLSEFGESDLAYHMITKSEYPSYGHLIEIGETTLPERLCPDDTPSIGSHCHHFFGDIAHWFIRQICGINVNPDGDNPNKVFIRPHFIKKLNYAYAYHDLPAGRITVEWKRDGERIHLTVNYPDGVICSVSEQVKREEGMIIEYIKCSS